MKRWYATLPPATRNRNIQLSFKRNLDEVPVAPETHGLQSDIETVCFSGSIWIYAKQDLCDHHHDHHHDDHHHDDHHHHHHHHHHHRHRHRHRHPHHHPHPHHHHHHHHQQQQQQPNRTRTCILQKATPNVNRQLNMLGHFQLRDCSNISSTKVDWRHHAEAPLVSSDVSPVFLFLRDPYIVSEYLLWMEKILHRSIWWNISKLIYRYYHILIQYPPGNDHMSPTSRHFWRWCSFPPGGIWIRSLEVVILPTGIRESIGFCAWEDLMFVASKSIESEIILPAKPIPIIPSSRCVFFLSGPKSDISAHSFYNLRWKWKTHLFALSGWMEDQSISVGSLQSWILFAIQTW